MLVDDLEQRLPAAAVHVRRQRRPRRPPPATGRSRRTSAARVAGGDGPAAARARRRRRRRRGRDPTGMAPPRSAVPTEPRSGRSTGWKPSARKSPISNTRSRSARRVPVGQALEHLGQPIVDGRLGLPRSAQLRPPARRRTTHAPGGRRPSPGPRASRRLHRSSPKSASPRQAARATRPRPPPPAPARPRSGAGSRRRCAQEPRRGPISRPK